MPGNLAAALSRYALGMKPATHATRPEADEAGSAPAVNPWWVYVIRCDDGSLYTGVSTDPERRFREHLQHPRGAKYFNGREPESIVYREAGHTRSSACQREAAIKKLTRPAKLALLAKSPEAKACPSSAASRPRSIRGKG